MKNKIIYTFLGLTAFAIAMVAFISIKQLPPESKLPEIAPNLNTTLKQCPDKWIDNQMPSTDPKNSEKQYFILNGVRRELVEFDLEWIEKNCNLKKQQVF